MEGYPRLAGEPASTHHSDNMILLRRTILYVPADKPRALDKARTLPCDAIIIDLEDAVSPDRKDVAREAAIAASATFKDIDKEIVLRINGPDTPWYRDDIAALRMADFGTIVVPKIRSGSDVKRMSLRTGRTIWPMMETAAAILDARSIAEAAAATGHAALIVGTNDLAAELGIELQPDRAAISMALQTVVLAAKAVEIDAIDGVLNVFGDDVRLKAEAEAGRALGMTGKTLIHPRQMGPVNEVFSPSAAALEEARRVVEAIAEAEEEGKTIATLDGRLVERLHAVAADRLLAQAEAIASRTAS